MNSSPGGFPPLPASNYEGIIWPPLHSGLAATLAALSSHLDRSQWLPAGELTRLQDRQLLPLAAHAAKQSPHFGRRLQQAGILPADLATPAGFEKLIPIGKRELQSAGLDFFCREIPHSHAPIATTKSSGSTGEPVVTHRTAVSQVDWLATTLRDHHWHGRNFSGRLCAVRAGGNGPVPLPDWGPPANLLFSSAPSLILPAATPINRLADDISRFAPACLVVYPSVLAGLIRHWKTHGLGFSGLEEVRLIGETFSADARESAREFLDVKLTDLYSSQEVGNIALQCPQSGFFHVMAETLRVEILDPQNQPCAPGETGRVVVTDLRNFASPLIRYDLGDYAEVAPPCPCGRGLPTLKRIAGRLRNLVTLPNGEQHWPQVGFNDYRRIAPIRQYQMIQQTREQIEVRLVADTPLTRDQEEALTRIIQGKLGHPFSLSFSYFDERLPTGPGGKFEEFLSLI